MNNSLAKDGLVGGPNGIGHPGWCLESIITLNINNIFTVYLFMGLLKSPSDERDSFPLKSGQERMNYDLGKWRQFLFSLLILKGCGIIRRFEEQNGTYRLLLRIPASIFYKLRKSSNFSSMLPTRQKRLEDRPFNLRLGCFEVWKEGGLLACLAIQLPTKKEPRWMIIMDERTKKKKKNLNLLSSYS